MDKMVRTLVSWMVAAALPLAVAAQAPPKPPATPEQVKPKVAPVKPSVKPRGDAPKGLPPSGEMPLLLEFDKAAFDEWKWKLQDMEFQYKDFQFEMPLLPEFDKAAFDELKWNLDDMNFSYREGKQGDFIAQLGGSGAGGQGQAKAQSPADRQRQEEARQRAEESRQSAFERAERWEELYAMGTESMHEQRWQRAVAAFDRVAASDNRRSDGALYWKAYSLHKLGRRDDALAALGELRQKHPSSRYLKEVETLEFEMTGKQPSPEAVVDDSIFELALSNLMMNAPDRALPIAERELRGSRALRSKERILFILAQSAYPASRDLLARVARGEFNPDLQSRAVRYLGAHGGRDNQQFLYDLFASTNDTDVKLSVLRSLTNSGRHDLVNQIAQNEANPDLRRSAIRHLANMGRRNELWTLYQKETDDDVRDYLLQMFANAGDAERLTEVARNAKDPRLRLRAIRSLGNMGASQADILVGLYQTERDADAKKMIMTALHAQNNAKALVELARREKDERLKVEIIRRLSTMRAKEATDYLMEILNK